MENQEIVNQVYQHAANLMFNDKKSASETKKILIEQGLDEESASIIVTNLEQEFNKARKKGANKDMIYGALWCGGGIIATISDVGFIFWGAILFGGIQLIKGIANSQTN